MIKVQMHDGREFDFPPGTAPEEIDSFAKEYVRGTNSVGSASAGRTFLNQSLQSPTFDYGDEITGTLGGLYANAYDFLKSKVTGEDRLFEGAGQAVSEGQKLAQMQTEAQMEERPLLSTVARLSGIVPILPVAGVVGRGAASLQSPSLLRSAVHAPSQILPKVSQAVSGLGTKGRIAAGAASGAASSYLAGTGAAVPGERQATGEEYAVAGGLLGAAIPAAAPVVGSVFQALRNSLLGAPARDVVQRFLGGADPKDLYKNLRSSSSEINLTDVAGDEAGKLLRDVAKTTGGTREFVSKTLSERSAQEYYRLQPAIAKNISPTGLYFQNLEDLAAAKNEAAKPWYKRAYSRNPKIKSAEAYEVLNSPSGTSTLGRTLRLMGDLKAAEGIPQKEIDSLQKVLSMEGRFGQGEKLLSLRALDLTKRALWDSEQAAKAGGIPTTESRAISQLRRKLTKALDREDVSGFQYATARRKYADFAELEDAQSLGLDFKRKTPEQIRAEVNSLTKDQHDAYMIGVRESLQRDIASVKDQGSIAGRIFGAPGARQKIKEALGPRRVEEYNNFAKILEEQASAQATLQRVLGGSRTDYNATPAGISQVIGAAQSAATGGGISGVASQLVGALATYVKHSYLGLNEKNARQVAEILLNREEGLYALQELMKKQSGLQYRALKRLSDDYPLLVGSSAPLTMQQINQE